MTNEMSLKSHSHNELMEMFERSMKSLPCCPSRMDREPRDYWGAGRIYQDGHVNAMFLAYRLGVTYGVAITR